jgi:pilus assembly protein CpaE
MTVDHPARCVLVTADRELAATVSDLVARTPGAELIATLEPARALAAPPSCEVVLVGDHHDRPASALAAELALTCPAGVVVLARDPDVATYRAALAAGARAVVGVPPSPPELVEAIGDAARRSATGAASAGGVLVAVAGAAGGVGTTATALALAAAGKGVLADIAHSWAPSPLAAPAQAGSVADLARVGPAVEGALDAVISATPGGFGVLAAPEEPEMLELLPAGMGSGLARELRARARLAVVDVGLVTHAAAREAAAASDRLLVVVTPDLRAAAAARALVTASARWGRAGAAGLVVNRWNRHAELSARALERTVGCPVEVVLRDRPRAMLDYRNGRADPASWPAGTPFRAVGKLAAAFATGAA